MSAIENKVMTMCPHCGRDIHDLGPIDPRKRWFYLKSMLQQYFDESSPIGQAVFTILSATSKLQSMYQSEQIKVGLQLAKENGKKLGRPKALVDASAIGELRFRGYSFRKIGEELQISARTARRIFASYDSGIHS